MDVSGCNEKLCAAVKYSICGLQQNYNNIGVDANEITIYYIWYNREMTIISSPMCAAKNWFSCSATVLGNFWAEANHKLKYSHRK